MQHLRNLWISTGIEKYDLTTSFLYLFPDSWIDTFAVLVWATSAASSPCWFDVLLYSPMLFSSVCHCLLSADIILYSYGISGGKASGRELTYWQSDLIENTVNPTLAQAFNLTSSLTHCRPINPLLNPKAFLFVVNVPPIATNPPLPQSHPAPISVCVCVCVC